jgi:hypothetical protein
MNYDGKLDIILTYTNDDTIAILLNQGNRSFSSAITYPVGNYPYWIDISDFNKNNLLDLVVANSHDASVTVLYDYSNLACFSCMCCRF